MTPAKSKKEAIAAMEFMRNNRDRVYLCAGYAWASFAAIAGHETCPPGPWDTAAPIADNSDDADKGEVMRLLAYVVNHSDARHILSEGFKEDARRVLANAPLDDKCPECGGSGEVTDTSGRVWPCYNKPRHKKTDLCSDCPPENYPTDETRCAECPRRA